MPSGASVQQSLVGAWRLMTGRPDGLRLLDLSVDGFWDFFFAMVIALPAVGVSWVSAANELAGSPDAAGERVSLLLRFALVEFCAWVLPLAALALIAPRAGFGDRFVAYVVSTNWASVLMAWIMLPASLLKLVAPELGDAAAILSLLLFVVVMVLLWRLTSAVIAPGPTAAVFFGVFGFSVVLVLVLQEALGLSVE